MKDREARLRNPHRAEKPATEGSLRRTDIRNFEAFIPGTKIAEQ